MTTKDMIETTADGSIVLPSYAHATDGWKFTDNEYGVLIFQSENKMLGMEFNIFIGWNDPQPHAELNPSSSHTFTEAENIYDVADMIDEFHAWLKDCAAAFDWIQTVDAEKGIDVLTMRESRHHDTPEIPVKTEDEEADVLPFVWADAGIALAAAGIEMNAPTPSADEVNALARLLHGFTLDTFAKGEALHDRVHA